MSCANVMSVRLRGALDDINNLKGNLGNTPSFSLEGAGENLSTFQKKWTLIT